jgi:serine protease Do
MDFDGAARDSALEKEEDIVTGEPAVAPWLSPTFDVSQSAVNRMWENHEAVISTTAQPPHSRSISFLILGEPEPASPIIDDVEEEPEVLAATSPRAQTTSASWSSKLLVLLTSVCLLLVMGMIGPIVAERMQFAITRGKLSAEYQVAKSELERPNVPLAELSKACQLVSYRIGPSVVHIDTEERSMQLGDIENSLERRSNGQGSGVIVDAKGYIVTNYHVVRGARQIVVGLSDGRPLKGEVLAFDAPTDIAVLKVKAENLIPAEWANSDELEIGGLVWAAGSPYGLDHSVTFAHQDFLQTDVAVNPGNSGGPLVDSRGRIVGINTAIVGQSFQGISFAIPSNVVKDVYARLLTKGRVDRGWLGVRLDPVPRELADAQGLDAPRGAVVSSLTSEFGHNSPAEAAGVKVGDIITHWDARPVAGPAQVIQYVSGALAGAKVKLSIVRDGLKQEVTVVIGARPAELN